MDSQEYRIDTGLRVFDDGVSNTMDAYDFTPIGVLFDTVGRPHSDLIQDCQVDLRDNALLKQSVFSPE